MRCKQQRVTPKTKGRLLVAKRKRFGRLRAQRQSSYPQKYITRLALPYIDTYNVQSRYIIYKPPMTLFQLCAFSKPFRPNW